MIACLLKWIDARRLRRAVKRWMAEDSDVNHEEAKRLYDAFVDRWIR